MVQPLAESSVRHSINGQKSINGSATAVNEMTVNGGLIMNGETVFPVKNSAAQRRLSCTKVILTGPSLSCICFAERQRCGI